MTLALALLIAAFPVGTLVTLALLRGGAMDRDPDLGE
jgi:hypothetical protein